MEQTGMVSPVLAPLPFDGRQSPVAAAVQRGVRRLFALMGHASLPEVTLASGRRADVLALSADGRITIVEIKSSVADFRADRKWPDYRDYCDLFFFAVPPDLSPDLIPVTAGLIVADSFGGAVLRSPEAHPLAAARRKAVTLRFARSAAFALQTLADPEHGHANSEV